MYQSFVKRSMDVLMSIVLLSVVALPLLIAGIILRFTGDGDIIFRQYRVGFRNRCFRIMKLCTMRRESPNKGAGFLTVTGDPRVTRFGNFLRKSKLDEFPQLINVIRGEMSLVGPRPVVDRLFLAYPEEDRASIYNVRPGITGIGSVVFRDEAKILDSCNMDPNEFYHQHIGPYKAQLEIWYQQNVSFIVDLQLLFLTFWAICFSKSKLHERMLKDLPKRPEALQLQKNKRKQKALTYSFRRPASVPSHLQANEAHPEPVK